MTVLILGGDDDGHAMHMLEHLRARGVDTELLDSRWFPGQMTISFEPGGAGAMCFPSGRRLDFGQVRSVYWRSYNGVEGPMLPDPEQAFIAENDARSLFESLLIHLPVRWVNGWRAYQLHQTKPVQLAMVAALGVRVPATLLTNEPAALLRFAEQYRHAIFKPVQGGALTDRLTPRHLTEENLSNLALAPVTVQEEIPGTNIRVFVIGQKIFACELPTEQLDYRGAENPDIRPHQLPPDTEQICLQVAQTLDLRWTGMDFRLTPEGEYVFLEANPSPMFLGFETRTGQPLTESLAELLLEA